MLDHTETDSAAEWDIEALLSEMGSLYDCEIQPDELDVGRMSRVDLVAEFQDDAQDAYEAKEEELGSELMREIERYLVLQVVDARWREHLDSMEYLRDGIHLRAMAQKDPLVEYRNEGSAMFEELNDLIREEVVRYVFHVEVQVPEAEAEGEAPHYDTSDQGGDGNLVYEHESVAGADAIAAATGGARAARPPPPRQVPPRPLPPPPDRPPRRRRPPPSEYAGVGRNDPCPCGSRQEIQEVPRRVRARGGRRPS